MAAIEQDLHEPTRSRGKSKERLPVVVPPEMGAAIAPLRAIVQQRSPGEHFTEMQEQAILQAIVITDGNLVKASAALGLGLSTVWKVKERLQGALVEQREAWKRAHSIKAQDLADLMAAKIAEKVETEDASLRDLTVAWGITVQRGSELAGDAVTVNHKHVHSIDAASLAPALERIKEIRSTRAPSDDVMEAEFTLKDDDGTA